MAALLLQSRGLLFGARRIGLQRDDRKIKRELARDLPKRPEEESGEDYWNIFERPYATPCVAVRYDKQRHCRKTVSMERYLAKFLWLLILQTQAAWGQDQCYFPGGQVAEGHSPCSPSQSTSFCCPFGYTCFSNHICIVTDPGTGAPFQASTRGSCSEKEWDRSACGDFCLSGLTCRPNDGKKTDIGGR